MIVNSDLALVTAIAIFVILVVVIYKSISEIPPFKGPIAFVMAVCTALYMAQFVDKPSAVPDAQLVSPLQVNGQRCPS